MPSHLSSSADHDTWDAPLIDGTPARVLIVVSTVGAVLGGAAALLLVVLSFVAPTVVDFGRGSLVGIFDFGCFAVGGLVAGIGFPLTFRQADREIAAGYTTLRWKSLGGSVPLVNPRTLTTVRGNAPHFDPAVVRARALWAAPTATIGSAPAPQPASPPKPSRTGVVVAVASAVLFASAVWVGVQTDSVRGQDAMLIGVLAVGGLVGAVLAGALILRAIEASRLAAVSQVASGIIVAGYSTPQVRASSDRLGIGKGVIPRVPVLVFNEEGFAIWRGSDTPSVVVSIRRRDVISLSVTTIVSGRTSVPGLQVAVIPPDERWPFLMEFTIYDPTRIFAAADNEKLGALISSITEMWTHGSPG